MTKRTVDADQYPRRAADAIRTFNHATRPRRDVRSAIAHPGTAYHVIGELTTLAQRLPQALDQTAEAVGAMNATGHLTADHGVPALHVVDTLTALRDAIQHANALTDALERAHGSMSPLGWSGPLPDTE
ncbi:hypothetical protein [Streptomyces sp. NPDC050264]|uniref:hypothetical protein n=1 Tax=Streptomyces sp. NPDC050264 TaxID=3155038 RepID=UPI00342CB85C